MIKVEVEAVSVGDLVMDRQGDVFEVWADDFGVLTLMDAGGAMHQVLRPELIAYERVLCDE